MFVDEEQTAADAGRAIVETRKAVSRSDAQGLVCHVPVAERVALRLTVGLRRADGPGECFCVSASGRFLVMSL